jgi:hypothetical protein
MLAAVLLSVGLFGQLSDKKMIRSSFLKKPVPNKIDAVSKKVLQSYLNIPLSFESNEGQAPPEVKFLSRGGGYGLFLTSTEAVISLEGTPSGKSAKENSSALRMKFEGARKETQVAGDEKLSGQSNYFIGKDPSQWLTRVAQFGKVRWKGLYPGVDMVFYGNPRQLEYDLSLAPGTDPQIIRLKFAGAGPLSLDKAGNLVLGLKGSDLMLKKPVAYQEARGVRRTVESRYVLLGNQKISFQMGPYDHSRPLVIDPVVAYATYLGGSNAERAYAIAVDGAGNAYVTGFTGSADFPLTAGAFQTALFLPSVTDVFVTKINPAGTALIYSTYLGGDHYSEAHGIAVDSGGNAYVTGINLSANFPITPGAAQTHYTAGAFVTKVNPSGTALVYSTFLGGSSGAEQGLAIAIDANGDAYVTGLAGSSNFPVTPGAAQPVLGSIDGNAFVTKVNPTGTGWIYSTFLGGSGGYGGDQGYGIAVDSSGCAYVTGWATSVDFPTTPGAAQMVLGKNLGNAFVTKVNAAGSAWVYSTFLGGTQGGVDAGYAIAVDGAGCAYAVGKTNASDFPLVNPIQATFIGNTDGFLTKVNAAGTAWVYSTFLNNPGSTGFLATAVALDSQSNAYVAASVPVIDKINPAGTAILYSFNIGGGDYSTGIGLDNQNNIYLSGFTSGIFSTTAGAAQTVYGGNVDGFVVKISDSSPTPTATVTNTPIVTFTSTNTPTTTPTYTATSTPTLTNTPTVSNTPLFTLTPTNTSTTTLGLTSTPTPVLTSTPTPTPAIYIWPNPFNPKTAVGGTLRISGMNSETRVMIFTLTGELVQTLDQSSSCPVPDMGGMVYCWDGKNKQGYLVSMGIYLYVVEQNNQAIQRGKFLMLNGT